MVAALFLKFVFDLFIAHLKKRLPPPPPPPVTPPSNHNSPSPATLPTWQLSFEDGGSGMNQISKFKFEKSF
jgi:hypothetical protein